MNKGFNTPDDEHSYEMSFWSKLKHQSQYISTVLLFKRTMVCVIEISLQITKVNAKSNITVFSIYNLAKGELS